MDTKLPHSLGMTRFSLSCVREGHVADSRGAMTTESIQTERLWRSGVGKRPIIQNSNSRMQTGKGFHSFKCLCKHLYGLDFVSSQVPSGPLCFRTLTPNELQDKSLSFCLWPSGFLKVLQAKSLESNCCSRVANSHCNHGR